MAVVGRGLSVFPEQPFSVYIVQVFVSLAPELLQAVDKQIMLVYNNKIIYITREMTIVLRKGNICKEYI